MTGGVLVYRGLSGICPVYTALGRSTYKGAHEVKVETTMSINKPVHEVYQFWRKLDNLPLFMKHLESVQVHDDKKSSWHARIPGGIGTINWDAEIVNEEENRLLEWTSLEGANIENHGHVTFVSTGDGTTELLVKIRYKAPLGMAGELISKLFTPVFTAMIKKDIAGFKQYIETGQLPDGQEQQ